MSGASIPIIDIVEVTKAYQKDGTSIPVLKDLTLRVGDGEFVAITGPSGSGKSTVLNILGLLDQPDTGRYRLGSLDTSTLDDDARSAIRNRILGFVFQQFHLLPHASAARNVALPLLYADEPPPDSTARVERALAAVGLSHRARHLPGELSGGEQQRVAIARALINDPRVLLADEPTGNLDAAASAQVLAIFRRLATEGRTIVLVTHDLQVAAAADRTIRLAEGRIVDDGPPSGSTGDGSAHHAAYP
jgi:putative ABC transport system ATP-binding protein